MAKYVTRTFVTTVIHGVSVYMDGDNCVTSPLADEAETETEENY